MSAYSLQKSFDLIDRIITADVVHGFPSAQLAVRLNGSPVYTHSWGKVTGETLYDLASNTKMYSIVYAMQHLVTEGKLRVTDRIMDYLGERFAENVIDVSSIGQDTVFPDRSRSWKAKMTIRDVLCHQAGFIANPVCFYDDPKGPFYAGIDGSPHTRQRTLDALCRMPLMCEPGTATLYSDADYILLCFVVEQITGQSLQDYLKQLFWEPLGLKHMTFLPLQNGFAPKDCAPTELHGNTRDGAVFFPGIRNYLLQGEVHDEKAWHCMGGISGHAGLFSNADDLARLADLMLDGKDWFSKDVLGAFTAPVSPACDQWGLGWWRQGSMKRTHYFGTHSSHATIGHQGWTGTLTMIDPEVRLTIALLTNKIHTPVTDPAHNPNRFDGNHYTTATLGFVPQLIEDCLHGYDPQEALSAMVEARRKQYEEDPCEASRLALDAILEATGSVLGTQL